MYRESMLVVITCVLKHKHFFFNSRIRYGLYFDCATHADVLFINSHLAT